MIICSYTSPPMNGMIIIYVVYYHLKTYFFSRTEVGSASEKLHVYCLVLSSTILDPRAGRFMDKSTPLPSVSRLLRWDVMAHWLRRLLSTGGSCVRLPLWSSRR